MSHLELSMMAFFAERKARRQRLVWRMGLGAFFYAVAYGGVTLMAPDVRPVASVLYALSLWAVVWAPYAYVTRK